MSAKANLAAICVLSQSGKQPVTFVLWSNVANYLTKSEVPDIIAIENNEGVATITASENYFIAVSVIQC